MISLLLQLLIEIGWLPVRNKITKWGNIHNVPSLIYCSGFKFQVTQCYRNRIVPLL